MSTTKEELATKIDLIDWFSLRAHLERGGLIVVDPMLDLAEVGAAVVADDVKQIERWVLAGMIGKPSAERVGGWDAEKDKEFLCLITSPYVLLQESTK
jgi:hypothetical protein